MWSCPASFRTSISYSAWHTDWGQQVYWQVKGQPSQQGHLSLRVQNPSLPRETWKISFGDISWMRPHPQHSPIKCEHKETMGKGKHGRACVWDGSSATPSTDIGGCPTSGQTCCMIPYKFKGTAMPLYDIWHQPQCQDNILALTIMQEVLVITFMRGLYIHHNIDIFPWACDTQAWCQYLTFL